ncbi:MAG: hypothetical protein V4722_12170 [Bacteroidota bacterium]
MKKLVSFLTGNTVWIASILAAQFFTGCNQNNDDHSPKQPDERPVIEPASIVNSGLQVYIDELADHRLYKFSNYNSGSGGEGMQSESWMDLCSNGRFFAHESSSVSIDGTTSQHNKDEQGTWEVTGSADAPMLKITATNGESGLIPISLDGTKLYLKGQRMYHIPKGEEHGPESCN